MNDPVFARVARAALAMQRYNWEQGVLGAAFALQRADGFFCDVLDDPDSFEEINCGQMLAFTVYRGVLGGWLGKELLPAADRVYETARSCVDGYGLVRKVCGAPLFDRPGVAAEGQAFFMMMHAARAQLYGST